MESNKLSWAHLGRYLDGKSTPPEFNLDEYVEKIIHNWEQLEKIFERESSTNNYTSCDGTTKNNYTSCDGTTN